MYAPTHAPQSLSANMADAALNRTNFGTPCLISSEIDSPFTRENDIFSPIVQDDLSDEPAMRLKGLRAYVTSDMKPDRQRESDRIFGRTLPFKSEFETNWRVGRALASATGYRDNPAAFYADPRFKSMGYQLPAHWDDVMQLYADLGAQFANKERTALQEQITKEQALVAERTKDPNALSQAIYKAVTRKHISTDDALILEYSGITADSLRKVNAALNLIQDNFSTAANKDGSFSTSDKADTFEVTQADFQDKQIAGLTEAESGIPSFISNIPGVALGEKIWQEYTANQQTDSLADFFGEDHVARGIFLELVRMAGAQQRYSEQGDSLTEQTANSIKAAGTAFYNASLKRWINAVLQNRAFSAPAPQGVDATLANSRRNAMHNDLLASFDAGYSRQSDELAADSSWLFNAARIPVSVADVAGSTAGWLNMYLWPIELAATLNENINTAESNIYSTDATEMQASFWERYGIAATQTAAAGISVYGVGKLMQGAGVLGQRYAPEVTRRVLGSRPLTYAANVTESTVSESLEELAQVGVQELMEGLGAVADRQKQDSLKRLRDTFTSPEYWSATVGFGLIAGIAGYRGSRSKYPYKFEQTLRELGFSKKESAALGNQVSDMVASGAKPEEISNLLSGKIYERILADPEKTTRKMLKTAHAYAQELRMQDFAAHGVRDTLIEQAGLKNLTRNADGSVSFITTEKGEDGIPKDVEKQMSAEDFNRWLITSASQEITARVLHTQALIRGEHLAQAAFNKQSEGKTPFARIAFLHDAPAEVLAQLRGSDTFNRKTLTLLGNYAVSEIKRRMAAGESPKQAVSAEFGSTGIPLGSIARTASDYDKRVSIAIRKGEIQSEKDAESASFMLAGRTTGDTILFLARGELEARDVAHEWMEGFARSRYFSDPESWRSRLDALDAELNARGYTRNSIFGNTPQNERTDLDYIEALTDIAQKHWLINADALNLTDNAKHLFGEILDDVGAIQNGLAFARELSNFINSAEGQAALGDSGALAKLMSETGTHLTDLISEADKSVPRTAAEFIQAHRDRIHAQVVSLADAKPATATPPPPNAELPESVLGVKGITQRDIQYANTFTEEGTLTTPPLTAYAAVTAPKGAGRGLIGGQAYKMPNRTIEGTARLSDLSLPKSMADADWPTLAALAATNPDADSPVCVYRHKSGKLELIGGIPAYARAKAAGQPIVHVRVYDPNDRHTRAWANNFSRAERIRSGAASVAENIAHIQTNKLTRTQARKANLIPRDANGQELPSSRAAWLLLNNASAQTIAHLKSGTITTREALETIAPKVDIESFSAQAAQSSNLFSKEGTLETADAIVTTPTSSFNIRAMHVSPHEFYKFSTDFMGSGEGVQAFGWGLYFMTSESINMWYYKQFEKYLRTEDLYHVYQDYIKETGEDLLKYRGHYSKESFVSALEDEFRQVKREYEALSKALDEVMAGQAKAKADLLEILAQKPKTKLGKALWLKAAVAKNLVSVVKKGKADIPEIRKLIEPVKNKLDVVERFLKEVSIDKPTNYRVELNVDDTNLLMWDKSVSEELKAQFRDTFLLGDESKSLQELHKEYIGNDKHDRFDILFTVEEFLPDGLSVTSRIPRETLSIVNESIKAERKKQDALPYDKVTEDIEWINSLDSAITFIDSLLSAPDTGYDMYNSLSRRLGSQKAASEWLAAHGYKGIKYLDGNSRSAGEGTYNYVIFSGDDIKITAINRSGVWSMDEGWEEYTDPTASFNIRKTRRRYSGVFSIANEPLYKALLETSRDFYKQYNNLLHAGGKNPSSILQAAAKALALKNAIYNVLPKDSQPWKAINDLSAKLQSLTEAARNPYADLPNNTPGLLPNEIQRYNELREDKHERSSFLQTRLSNLTGQLLRSTQKSLESYLCRKLIDSAEHAYQTLQPKLQPSGKERRGITDTETFNKAAILHDMMFWSAEKAAKESEAAENEMNKPDATEADVAAAEQRLAEIALFGNLHEAGYEQTQKAVALFIELIETGRARWEEVITEERAKTREQQNNLARLHPKVDASKVEKEAAKSSLLSKVARLSESLQNAVQLISSFSKIGGGVGDFFTRVRNDVANATNRVTFDTQKARRDQNAELDRILGIQGLNIVSRDIQRANFIEKTKQRVSTGIMTAGRLKKSTFKFAKGSTDDGKATNAEILELAALRDSDRQAFIARMKKIQNRPGAKMDGEDDANNTLPYDQALDLALEHIADENYKGGEVFITVGNRRGSNTSYEIELTAQQIADLVLRSEQPSYQNKYDEKGNLIERGAFDNAGFTEEVIAKLHDYLDKNYKGLMDYAYWMRDYLNTTGLFEAYEKYMGIPFPKEENYWPSSFNSPNEISNLNALAADYQGGGVYQMLIKRKKHTFDPKTTPSLEDVFSHAINMHYTYIHVSHITREMRAFLRDPDTRTRLASISGQQSVQLLTKALDMLDAMPAVQNIADRSLTNWTGKILGGVARLALTANPVTWLKNTSGLINATVDKDLNVFSVLLKAIPTLLNLGGPMTRNKILELDAFKIRYNRESLTNNARKLGENETQSWLSYIPIGSTIVLERIDAHANAASMAVLYNHHYKAARNVYHQIYGKDIPPHIDEEAHRIAENAVAVALHQNSQPLELHDKALAFQNKTSGVMAMTFMKSEAIIKLGAAYMSAKEELNKMPSNATALQRKVIYAKAAWSYYRVLASGSAFNQGVLMLVAAFTLSGYDDEEDEFLPWLIGNTVVAALGLGYFSAIPYLGEMSSTAVSGSLQLLGNLTDIDLLKKTPGAANVASTGLQLITGQQLVNLGKAFEDSGNTGADLLHLANAIRLFGIGAAILFPRTNQALTIGEEILGGINALFTFARPELQRIKNQEKKEKKRKKKPSKSREEIHRQLGIQ